MIAPRWCVWRECWRLEQLTLLLFVFLCCFLLPLICRALGFLLGLLLFLLILVECFLLLLGRFFGLTITF